MPTGVYKRKPFLEEHKRKIGLANSIALKGKKFSEKHKRKLSEAHKGQKVWNKGKEGTYKHSEEARRKISESKRGDKHPNWKGGISFEPYSVDWTETLRRSIRERDNYICQLCSQYGNTVHHIDYDKKNCNPDNLITLCRSCNSKVNKNRNYWINYFMNTKKYAEEINKETQIAGETEKLPVINIENKNEKI